MVFYSYKCMKFKKIEMFFLMHCCPLMGVVMGNRYFFMSPKKGIEKPRKMH